ncbi:TnsA endonuclease N-terminal domain-containing protein [Acinetobacter seifertii]|uniref:TnsA endonuclease N-terminal domain-containing protein n=1 Tax=Acinetobacter seifertii TaxID=1530123 RepID=UPI00148C3E96|nr:TnsA endonuclease N-terminal domain-containing protein [Acinetobacter seifertii]
MNSQQKKPVRKIAIGTSSIRGTIPTLGQYESSLERDFMELVRFDNNVELYTPQPVRISFRDRSGRKTTYVPDGLIEYRHDIYPASELKPVLCEIKYRDDFRKDWKRLIDCFKAAKVYALEQGWVFKVYTEFEIRTNYLKNIKFLIEYRNETSPVSVEDNILIKLEELRISDPETLLVSLFRDPWMRADAIRVLWRLIALRRIGCDLTEALTMRSKIWTMESRS